MKKFVKAYVNGNEALINISAIAAVIFYDDGAFADFEKRRPF